MAHLSCLLLAHRVVLDGEAFVPLSSAMQTYEGMSKINLLILNRSYTGFA